MVRALARERGQSSVHVASDDDDEGGAFSCDWMLITRNEGFLDSPDVRALAREDPPDAHVVWSDDRCNLLGAMSLLE